MSTCGPSISSCGTRSKRLSIPTNDEGENEMKLKAIIALGCAALASNVCADVKLPAIFSDNMVLQRSEKAPFFGTADKGEKVTVKVGQASAEATAGDDGKWRATL